MVLGQLSLHYRLYLPSNLDRSKRLPLLMMLHGCSQTALEFAEGTRMDSVAERRHCAVLYPEQSKRFNSLRCWNWFAPDVLAGEGEAALLMHTVRHVMEHQPIDPARLYVAGMSAGGAMAAVLCATHGDLIAACAIHSGIMFHAATNPLQAFEVMRHGAGGSPTLLAKTIAGARSTGKRLVPTLLIHGAADETVNPRNAEQFVEQVGLLARSLASNDGAVELREEQWFEAGGRRYRQQDLYQGSELLVRSIVIEGLGHAWSGGNSKHQFFDPAGPDASELIIEFLLPSRLPEMEVGDTAKA
jgi:poly(hydroxyalkanoate) depolymerase family esterase